MTHVPEDEFQSRAKQHLVEWFGEENVEREVFLPDSYRFADFIVQGDMTTWAIEAENDAASVVAGVGQAFLYAAHFDMASPAVVVPADHTEEPEISMLRRYIPVIEI